MNDADTAISLRARNARHHIHPFSDMDALNAEGVRIITHAEGVWLRDIEGRRFLDGFSGLWNVAVGYGRTEIADAVNAQMRQLPFYNNFFKSTTIPRSSWRRFWPSWRPVSAAPSSPIPAPRPTTPSSAWCAITGSCAASRPRRSSSRR